MKAIIDIDWLDAEIAKDHYDYRFRGGMDFVRSKCEPIEEPKREGFPPTTGILTELPPKCLLDWESAKYCHNSDKCGLCNTKSAQ